MLLERYTGPIEDGPLHRRLATELRPLRWSLPPSMAPRIRMTFTSDDSPSEWAGDSFTISGDWLTILDGHNRALCAERIPAHAESIRRVDE